MAETVLLDHPIISQRYFFPRSDSLSEPFWVDCDEARLACFHHVVDPKLPTIVHFHGNGEVVADYLDGFPQLLEHMGCNCFLAEFRGYGGSTGSPQLGKMLQDVEQTIRSIEAPTKNLILFGRSVGSLFAIKAAERFPDVAGLILESAIADPLERLLLRLHPEELGVTAEELAHSVHDAIDVKNTLENFLQPALIMHTRHDGLIDVSHGEQLARWCAGPTRLKIFPSGSHNDIMFVNSQEYFEEIKRFLATLED
jgi:pimeloyl-ACP methyl ester carboxylesterase